MTPAAYTINGITFNAGGSAFVINSGTAGVNGFTLAGNISNLGTNLQTINDGIVLSAVETVAMSAGGGNITLGGPVSGAGGITVTGSTTSTNTVLTLSGDATYLGTTTVPEGSMIVTGTLGSSSAYSGAITVGINGTNTGAAGQTNLFEVNGGTVYAASLSILNGNGSSAGNTVAVLLTGGGSITLSGNLAADTPNLDSPGLVTITSGTLSASSATVARTNTHAATAIATTPITNTVGIYVNGGTLDITTTLGVGIASTSSAYFRMDSGFVNVGGIATVADEAGMRYSYLNVNGGTFTDSDTSGVGMWIGGVADANEYAELLVTSGTLNTPAITLGGSAQTSGADAFVADGGITYIGSGGIVSLGGGASILVDLGINTVATAPIIVASGTWTSTVPMTLATSNTGGLVTFQTANASGTPEAITLGGALSGSGGFNETGGGILTLSGDDTFTGAINIPVNNTVAVTGAGALGSGTYAGAISDSGTLSYSSSVNQTFSGVVTVGGALIENGPGPLRLAGADTVTGSLVINGGTLAISPGGTLNGGSYSGSIPDAGTFTYGGTSNLTLSGVLSGTGGVTEAGPGRLLLTGPNTYTGPTAITSGTLVVASTGSLGDTAITVSQGATFLARPGGGNLQIGVANASLTLNAGSTFSMADGTIGTVTINSGSGTAITLNGSSTSPDNLTFALGHTGADELLIPNGGISFGTSPTPLSDINFVPLNGAAPSVLTNIPILSIPNGVLTLADFSLGTPSVTFGGSVYDASLTLGGPSNTELLLSLLLAGSANYYFTGKGGTASWGTLGNFAVDNTGVTAQSQLPLNTTNIFLTADQATNYQTQTIDGNFQVNSLNFTGTDSTVGNTPAATTGITLNSGTATAPLDILATSSIQDTNGNLYAAGTGLVVQAGSAAHTINANINLGNNQTWEIDNSPANPLTMNGIIGDGSTLDFLNKTGNGTLILANANTYDGGTIVSAGTLMMGSAGTLAPLGPLTVQGTGTFDLAGTTQTVSGLSDGGVATGVITSSIGAAMLNINNTTPSSYSGVITDNNAGNGASLTLTLGGSSTVTLSGSNSFTGGTTLNSGNLTISNNYGLGSATSANANAGITVNAGNAFFTSANPNVASVNGAGDIVLGNPAGSGSATTLFIGGGGTAQTNNGDIFTGVISDQSGTAAGAVGNIVVYGGAFLELEAANTFTGTVTVTGTSGAGLPSELFLPGSTAVQDALLNINNTAGEFVFGAATVTVGGLVGNSVLNLVDSSSAPLTLSVGNNNTTSNFPGTLAGPGGITTVGGTFTLSGTQTFTGGISALAGTLDLTGAYGTSSSPGGGITVGTNAAGSGTAILAINGGTVYAPSFTEDSGPNSGTGIVSNVFIGQNGTGGALNLSGNLAVDSGNGDENSLFEIESGTVTAPSATIGRGNANLGGTPGTPGTTTDGIYVDGGNLDVQTTLQIGSTQTSTAEMRMDSGSVTVGGVTTITNAAGSRFSALSILGGTFTDQDTSGVGILIGGNADTTGPLDAELIMESGTLNTPEITMGGAAQTSGIDEFLATGGLIQIGSGGIINGNPTGTTVTVALGLNTSTNAPSIEATATWTSSLNMTLTNGVGGLTPTFITTSGSNITLSGALSGGGGLTAAGTGTLTLSGANSYSGNTVINGGVLNAGSATALGDTSAITFGGGTLQYSGSNTTDYSPLIASSTSPISIDTNGQVVTFGTTFASSNTGGLNVVDSMGTGSLTLTQANTYAGPTSIGTGGNLILSGSASLGNTAISVATGGTFAPNPGGGANIQLGSTGATLGLAAGAGLSLGNGFIGTVTLDSPGAGTGTVLTLGGTTASPDNLTFDVGSTGADELVVNDGVISFAGTAKDDVIIDPISGAAPGTTTNIPLISDPNGSGLSLSDFSLQTSSISIGGAVYDLSLHVGGTGNDELLVNLTQVGSANFYFTGRNNSSWQTITNFAPDSTGATSQGGTLGPLDSIFLTSNNAINYTSETLDGNYTINSLSFTGTNATVGNTPAATAGITLTSGTATAPLVIAAGNGFSDVNGNNYNVGTGLVVQAGSAAHTILANINLGSSQTWEIDNSASTPLTMGGVIGDGTTLDSLTKTGVGTLILTNNNTYNGGTIVKAGTVQLGIGNALLPTSGLTVTGAGTFDMAGFNQTIASLSDGGVSTGVITSSTGSATLTINNPSAISYKGTITDNNAVNGAMLSLLLSGSSVVTLSGSNSYSGLTTLTGGTLIAANNYALGSGTSANSGILIDPALTATVRFTSNNPTISALVNTGTGAAFVILGNSTNGTPTTLDITGGDSGLGGTFSGNISDLSSSSAGAVGNLDVSGGTVTLDGSDTFTGTTVISTGGTLVLGNTAALQDSTLFYNNQGGTLSFGALTAATLGGLTGDENLSLTNASANPVALTFGINGGAAVYSGGLGGGGSIAVSGTGTETLSGVSTFTGNTTVNSGVLNITNTLGTSSTTTGAMTVSTGTLGFNGATVYASSLSQNGGGYVTVAGASNLTIAGTLAANSNNSDAPGAITLTSGTVTAATVTVGRDSDNLGGGSITTGASTTDGLYVNGATLNVTGTFNDGGTGNNSSSQMRIDAGAVNVTGPAIVGNAASSRLSLLDINGGTFTDQDTSGIGLQIGGIVDAAGSTELAELLLRGTGVLYTPEITFGNVAETNGGTNYFIAIGGTAYIGSGGIVEALPTTDTATIDLGSTTVGTSPTIAASASWTSSMNMVLSTSSNSTFATFQAANISGSAENITLSGALSGAGGLATTGAGVVTLSGSDGYTGATTVSAGRLIISGSVTGTTSVTVGAGANLEVDGLLTSTAAAAINGRLSGIGTVNGASVLSTGTLAAGFSAGSTTPGTLTSTSNVAFNSTTGTLSIRLGLTTGASGDNDQLSITSGALTLDDTTLHLSLGAAEAGAAVDTLYDIVSGGAGGTGSGTDVFANAPASGDSITVGNAVFDVFYAVAPGSTSGPGPDIAVELVSVPEPGTWAEIIAGIGVLCIWQRSRRRVRRDA